MNRLLIVTLLIVTFTSVIHAQHGRAVEPCTSSLGAHVYHPDRLVLKRGCITVTGEVIGRRTEDDGDIHFQLKVDRGFSRLMNEKNRTGQGGFLVFEVMCVKDIKQENARDACTNFTQKFTLPRKGDRVSVTGLHVLDTEHGWMEIHPVSRLKILKTNR